MAQGMGVVLMAPRREPMRTEVSVHWTMPKSLQPTALTAMGCQRMGMALVCPATLTIPP